MTKQCSQIHHKDHVCLVLSSTLIAVSKGLDVARSQSATSNVKQPAEAEEEVIIIMRMWCGNWLNTQNVSCGAFSFTVQSYLSMLPKGLFIPKVNPYFNLEWKSLPHIPRSVYFTSLNRLFFINKGGSEPIKLNTPASTTIKWFQWADPWDYCTELMK